MAATVDSEPPGSSGRVRGEPSGHPVGPAARRLWLAEGLLGVLALVSFAFVFMRLFARWRVTPDTASHRIAVFGQRLGYPVANAGALVVLGLGLLGVVVLTITILAAAKELRASRRFVRRLAAARPLAVHGALVIADERPQAFCAGLLEPKVYVTTGALALLDGDALAAVLTHERHHAQRRDPLRIASTRVLARALFFLPGIAELGRRREMLVEMSADESAIAGTPTGRSALARAMLSFTDSPDGAGIDPARVDHLLGEPSRWRFPTLVFMVAVFLLALLAAVAVLVGQEAAGSASLAPPFLSAQPCVAVLALIPVGLALLAVAVMRAQPQPK